MLGFLESPKQPKREVLGHIPENEIQSFNKAECDSYLSSTHTKKELKQMSLQSKRDLISDLEYNFFQNSF